MSIYRYDRERGCMVDKKTGKPMVDHSAWKPVVPRITSDIQEYRSPVTGEPITSRRQERDHMARHDVVHATEVRGAPRKLKNKRFVEKHGLHRLSEI